MARTWQDRTRRQQDELRALANDLFQDCEDIENVLDWFNSELCAWADDKADEQRTAQHVTSGGINLDTGTQV